MLLRLSFTTVFSVCLLANCSQVSKSDNRTTASHHTNDLPKREDSRDEKDQTANISAENPIDISSRKNFWTATSTAGAPSSRASHTAVWAGSKMIVWGGSGSNHTTFFNDGGVFDPVANSWTSTSSSGAPSERSSHTAVWTDAQMIVWGGHKTSTTEEYFNDGGRYDPSTNSWVSLSTAGAPTPRYYHTAIWTGSKMLIWGGFNAGNAFSDGGSYDPTINAWTTISPTNAPPARHGHTAVWTGAKMIVWGGNAANGRVNDGGIYDPTSDTWTTISVTGAPEARVYHSAVWTGKKMIIWGGYGVYPSNTLYNNGAIYDPTTDSWSPLSTANAPGSRTGHIAVWSGSKMIVWGGSMSSFYLSDGAAYDPDANSWTTISYENAPTSRVPFNGIWTGSKMIIWGGGDSNSVFNTGGIYSP